MNINPISGKVLTILGGILILFAISLPMQLAEEQCNESGPGIEENKCYFELLDRYLSCKETQDRYSSGDFKIGVYSCSISGWNSGPAAIYSGIAGGLLVIYGVLGKEKDGRRFSIPVVVLSALLMIGTIQNLFGEFNVPGPTLLLIGAIISARGGYSREISTDFDPSKLKNMWLRYLPSVYGPLFLLVILIGLFEPGGLAFERDGTFFIAYPLPVLLSILVAARLKNPLLSFMVSLLLSAIGYLVVAVPYAFSNSGIGP